LMNLGVAERNLIYPRILQVMGLGMTTVPLSTIMFRFLPADQTSNAAGIYALVRNEGGSIGIALSSTFLQRMTQAHQTYIGANVTASNALAMAASHAGGAVIGGSNADQNYAGMALLYHRVQQQASLLAYMDQFRLFSYILIVLLPLVLLLKRPPRIVGKITLDAH
jgi:DHA2 family multidrug resistance protein